MKIGYEYSHLGGRQILQVDYPTILKEVHDSIQSIGNIQKNKASQEKTNKGKMVMLLRSKLNNGSACVLTPFSSKSTRFSTRSLVVVLHMERFPRFSDL